MRSLNDLKLYGSLWQHILDLSIKFHEVWSLLDTSSGSNNAFLTLLRKSLQTSASSFMKVMLH